MAATLEPPEPGNTANDFIRGLTLAIETRDETRFTQVLTRSINTLGKDVVLSLLRFDVPRKLSLNGIVVYDAFLSKTNLL